MAWLYVCEFNVKYFCGFIIITTQDIIDKVMLRKLWKKIKKYLFGF